MIIEFEGTMWFWRGPAPHHFVTVPADACDELRVIQRSATYGWGMIPVTARINGTVWTTSLFPKDGHFIVPIKNAVRMAEGLSEGDLAKVRLDVSVARP